MLLHVQELGKMCFYSPNQSRDDHGRWGSGGESSKVSTPPPAALGKYSLLALKKYGETNDVEKAGYVLANGKMLDLSGGQSYRAIAHSDVTIPLNPELVNYGPIGTLKQEGAVRISASSDSAIIEIGHIPLTAAQKGPLQKLIENQGGSAFVEVTSDPLSKYPNSKFTKPVTSWSRQYEEGTKPSKIQGDIARAQRGEKVGYSRL